MAYLLCSTHNVQLVLKRSWYIRSGKRITYTYYGCPVAKCNYKRADKHGLRYRKERNGEKWN